MLERKEERVLNNIKTKMTIKTELVRWKIGLVIGVITLIVLGIMSFGRNKGTVGASVSVIILGLGYIICCSDLCVLLEVQKSLNTTKMK